jgi:hypothetical protein
MRRRTGARVRGRRRVAGVSGLPAAALSVEPMTTARRDDVPGEVADFRVRPFGNRALFVRVRVFRSYRSLFAFGRSTGTTGQDWYAIFRPHVRRVYGTDGYVRTIPEFGDLLFTVRNIELADVIVHECVHAGIEYARRVKADLTQLIETNGCVSVAQQRHSTEERIALCTGFLVRAIVNKWDQIKSRGSKSSNRVGAAGSRAPSGSTPNGRDSNPPNARQANTPARTRRHRSARRRSTATISARVPTLRTRPRSRTRALA